MKARLPSRVVLRILLSVLLSSPLGRTQQAVAPAEPVPATPLSEGREALSTGKLDQAAQLFTQALNEARVSGDRSAEADVLSAQSNLAEAHHDSPQAIALLTQAVAIRRDLARSGDASAQSSLARSLDQLASACSRSRQTDQAVAAYQEELLLSRRLHDQHREAETLSHLATQSMRRSQYAEAIDLRQQAAALFAQLKNPVNEAVLIDEIGVAYDAMSDYERAITFHQRALDVFRKLKDQTNEALTLISLSNSYEELGRMDETIALLQDALAIFHGLKNREDEGYTLDSLGIVYNRTGQHEKAIQYHEQALVIARELHNKEFEADVLSNLSLPYKYLHDIPHAIDLEQQALAVYRELHNVEIIPRALANLGIYYEAAGEYEKALETTQQALTQILAGQNRQSQAIALTDLGEEEEKLGHHEKAIASLEQAIALTHRILDRSNEGDARYKLGCVDVTLRHYPAAQAQLEQAVLLARQVKDLDREAQALQELAIMYRALQRPELSIFFGKQAVNVLQSIRAENSGLSAALRQTYVEGSSATYQQLADTLMALGRLPEAQEVLDLLKEDEYFNFVRRDPAEAPTDKRQIALSTEEAEWNRRYAAISTQIVALSSERDALLQKPSLTPAEKIRLTTLDKDYELANQGFEKFLTRLAEDKPAITNAPSLAELRDTTAMQQTLSELGHGAVAIYTLIGETTFRAILVTPSAQKGYEVPITAADLNRKIFALRAALQNPEVDPRPAAVDLYEILIAPMEADLQQARASTLMWSLDGTLRYIPLAALYDGHRYLAERYRTAVFTPASVTRLKDPPSTEWAAAGFGLSKSIEGAPALPGVPAELNGIIRQNSSGGGVMSGEIRLDDAFTEAALREAIRSGQFPVLHIASHFRLQPGNDASSFLLLGDGEHLSLTDMGVRLKGLFRGVNLMTLSACETGIGGASRDGHEVEGFGVLAQRNGAKSVVASLWSVADNSTSEFMRIFYRNLGQHSETKLDALRDAQLSLLYGGAAQHYPLGDAAPARSVDPSNVAVAGASFPSSPDKPFAHPFYWAPFFMMGNWL